MALLVARDIIIHMLSKRPDVREAMIAKHYRVVVMATTEMTTDLSEQRNWKKPRPLANMTREALARVYPDHHVPMDIYYAKDIHPKGHAPGNPPGQD